MKGVAFEKRRVYAANELYGIRSKSFFLIKKLKEFFFEEGGGWNFIVS